MTSATKSPQFEVLHVLTLNGKYGEYGGPVRVARELCLELNSRGHSTHIFSGALIGSEPESVLNISESFEYVKPLTEKLKVSSLWSWKLFNKLYKLISNSERIHIHFARDLITISAAYLSILRKKPYYLQTHGMIKKQNRILVNLIDFLIIKKILKNAKIIFCLTSQEKEEIAKIGLFNVILLPNGISPYNKTVTKEISQHRKIVFLSRIHKRKNLHDFIQVAHICSELNLNYSFAIHGPDGGDLENNLSLIESLRLRNISYEGPIPFNNAQEILANYDIMILPSFDEPFSMVVLEALSVGTPVIVYPSIGIAKELQTFDSKFVTTTETPESILERINELNVNYSADYREKVQKFCYSEFEISRIVDKYLIYIDNKKIIPK